MTPVLQRLRTLAVRVLLRLAFLRQVPLVVRHHLAHVLQVVVVVFAGVFLRVLLQDLDDLAAAVVVYEVMLALSKTFLYGGRGSGNGLVIDGHQKDTDLSCPIVSPEPSSLLHPAPTDSSLPSQSFNSLADMLTRSLNSLIETIMLAYLIQRESAGDGVYWMTVSSSFTILPYLWTPNGLCGW